MRRNAWLAALNVTAVEIRILKHEEEDEEEKDKEENDNEHNKMRQERNKNMTFNVYNRSVAGVQQILALLL